MSFKFFVIIGLPVASVLSLGCVESGVEQSPWAGTPYDAQPEIRSAATSTFAPVPTLGEPIRVRGDQSVRPSLGGESVLDLESLSEFTRLKSNSTSDNQ